MSKYYRQNMVPVARFIGGYQVMRKANTWHYYCVNGNETQLTRIPDYVCRTAEERDKVTKIIGPYVFLNNFEDTPEGKYLIKMLPHWFNRKDIVEQKIADIMENHGWWVRINPETVAYMKMWYDAGRMYQIRRQKNGKK